MLGSGRNVSKALELLLFDRIDTEFKSHIQTRILVLYKMRMHMPAEHTGCNEMYTILPKQKVNMFPR